MNFKHKIIKFLRWTEQYTNTDMVYLARGGFWQTVNKAGTFLIGIGTMSALSRWIPKETYGAYKYVLSITTILSIATLPGMGSAVTRAIARGKEGEFWKSILERVKWSGLGMLASLVVAGWYFWQGNHQLGYVFILASFLFPLPYVFNSYNHFWKGRKRFDVNARQTVGINFFEAVAFLPVVVFFDDLITILLAYFVSRSVFRGVACYLAYGSVSNDQEDEETLSYGKHLTLMGAIGKIAGRLDRVIIWQFLGPVQVAIYSFARLPVDKAKSFIPIGALTLPKLSEKSLQEIKEPLLEKFYKLFLVSVPAGLVFFFLAPYFYRLLFPDYMQSVPLARALSLMIVFIPFSLLNTSLVAEMEKRALYAIRFSGPILKILLMLALVPLYGLWGLVAALLITQVFSGVLVFYFFRKV